MEISLNSHESLREAVLRRGGKAIVVNPGLSESRSHQERAWKLIAMYEPRHVWLDLRQPWTRRVGTGAKELWPEQFLSSTYSCIRLNEVYIFICFVVSPLLQEVQHGTLHVVYDPLELGLSTRLHGNSHLRQQADIHTTSRGLQQATDTRLLTLRPGQTSPPSPSRNSSAPRSFEFNFRMSDRVARNLLQDSGMPLPVEELLFGDVKRNLLTLIWTLHCRF